jgi:hypothetical protein
MTKGTLILLLLAGEPATITLSCAGKINDMGIETELLDQSLVINLNSRRMTGSLGDFFISGVGESKITFAGENSKGEKLFGSLDRIAGTTRISLWGPERMAFYYLACKLAKPLF